MLLFLLLLACPLPSACDNSCFHCWPALPAMLEYDLQILWGPPGPPVELSQSLQSIFLTDDTSVKSLFLGERHSPETREWTCGTFGT